VGNRVKTSTYDYTMKALRPVVKFSELAETVYTDEVIRFNASDSHDPDGTIVSYLWGFNYRTNSTDEKVDHSYAEYGNYTVILTVTDDDGASSSMNETKIVEGVVEWPFALLAAIGLGIAALIATLLYGLYRRRSKRGMASNTGSKTLVTIYVPSKLLAGHN